MRNALLLKRGIASWRCVAEYKRQRQTQIEKAYNIHRGTIHLFAGQCRCPWSIRAVGKAIIPRLAQIACLESRRHPSKATRFQLDPERDISKLGPIDASTSDRRLCRRVCEAVQKFATLSSASEMLRSMATRRLSDQTIAHPRRSRRRANRSTRSHIVFPSMAEVSDRVEVPPISSLICQASGRNASLALDQDARLDVKAPGRN